MLATIRTVTGRSLKTDSVFPDYMAVTDQKPYGITFYVKE